MTQDPQDEAELSFEDALRRLDETVRSLEAGGLALDDATRLYEEGMKLARVCTEKLSAAELTITRIKTAYGEQIRLVQDPQTGPPS